MHLLVIYWNYYSSLVSFVQFFHRSHMFVCEGITTRKNPHQNREA